jgi:teichuronic acid biosynthesis glycosyltransferase TuaG
MNEDLMRYRVLEKSHSRNKLNSAKEVWHIYRAIENLSFPHAGWCFASYAFNGWRKYRRF